MKTIRELNIKDWSGYFFDEMVNILDIDPECFIVGNVKECTYGTMLYNIYYSDKTGVPHITFNNIGCYFKKDGDYSSLIFCDNDKNKNIINIYFKIIKQLRDEVFSLIDEFEGHNFVFAYDFTIFRFIKMIMWLIMMMVMILILGDLNLELMIICYTIKILIFLFM